MRQQYEPSADRIIALYQQLEDDILSAVIRRILKMGYVSEASKHQLEVLQAAGLLYDDIVQLLADRTDACTAQVKALFEDAGVQTVAIDNSLHEAAGALPIDIRQDSSTRQVLEAGYKKTLGTMQNLVSTTATQTQTAFIQTCDRIYMQVSSGAFSYQEAIMNALRALADTGATVSYPTGHTDRMDVAVRRCVLTGVSQTAAAVSLQQAEDAGCYLMEITAHSGARPDHAKWQGQLVTITGKDAGKIIDGLRVFTLSEIGYGSGEGFKGWNCHHNWHAYYPGLSTPNYTQEELKKLDEPCISYNGKLYTEYEVSQMQRAQERRVRAWKRRCITAQEGVNSATDEATRATAQAEYSKSAVHLKANEEKLKDFCKQTGQNRDRFREQVLGFNKSTAQKAVHAAKKIGLTSGGKDGIIKSIDVDDFEMAVYGKNINSEVSDAIVSKMNDLERKGKFYISEVKVARIYGKDGGIPALQIEPLSNGLLRLNINTDVFSGYTLEEIDQRFLKASSTIANNLEEALIHESGHAKSIARRSASEIQSMYEELSKIHINGISECAFSDGAECLAEVEVLLSRGEAVPENAMKLYRKYVLRE